MPPPVDHTVFTHTQERFETRARALFYARLALMSIGLGVLLVPAWRRALVITLPEGAYWYLFILAYHVASYLWVDRRYARPVIFATLCLDLLAILYLLSATGGLDSPLMPTQLVFTMLFALLFPTPLAIIPPLLTLPIVAKVDQILGTQNLPGDLLLVLWYSALNVTVVYVVVYLEGRERAAFREVVRLQRERRAAALEGERARIAREVHDSVGAALSGVLLQAEYLESQVDDPALEQEVAELREAASDGMEELRRAVSMMRRDFLLVPAIEEHVAAFGRRHRLEARFAAQGVERDLDPERQLALFRILQEALTNVARHAHAGQVDVSLELSEVEIRLRVADDGQGFAHREGLAGHYGLRNMAERALRLGGSLDVDTAPGEGTRITAVVPAADVGPGRG